jgi:hypothetical protein
VILQLQGSAAYDLDQVTMDQLMDPVAFPTGGPVEVVVLGADRACLRGTIGDLSLSASGAEYVFATLRQVHAATWASTRLEHRALFPSSFRKPDFDMFSVYQQRRELLPVAVAVAADVATNILAKSWGPLAHHLRRNGLEPVLVSSQQALGYTADPGMQSAVLSETYSRAIPLLYFCANAAKVPVGAFSGYPLTWDICAMGYKDTLLEVDNVIRSFFDAVKAAVRKEHPRYELLQEQAYDPEWGPLHPRYGHHKDGPHVRG